MIGQIVERIFTFILDVKDTLSSPQVRAGPAELLCAGSRRR